MTTPLIAVYGAYGHTGRLVAAELRSRNQNAVLAGRDAEALRRMGAELGYPVFPAAVDDPAALRDLAQQADVLIHCAGPFSVTGGPLATAAVETGCHYVDHAVESHHVRHLFEEYDGPAQEAGIAMVPGMSFYGGLGDLLAATVSEGLHGIERLTTAYAVNGWRMTTGAKATAAQLFAETERITFTDGEFHIGYVEPRNVVYPFPPPIGPRTMIAPFPSCEIVMIPRHVPARTVEALLTAETFTEEQVFVSEHVGPDERARSRFTVAAQAIAAHGSRAAHLTGTDLWRAGALASVEGALRLLEVPAKTGVLSPAEAFAPEPLLRTLERLGAFTIG
ncbi:saccharopine dehydrogenase NADP-binding domain-containing protein [Spirillospora sp. NPDC047279]|uniref:saccharopine dehydrogenase NADP-binding domain-containing protein n=1 Tax=Spirillospora sp. NPDC047279 TaxID=3155478 RepID=UPI00340E1267